MANEVSLISNISFASGGLSAALAKSLPYSPSSLEVNEGILAVQTTDTALPLGGVVAPGWIVLLNMDATNFVTVGADGTNYDIKIGPGQAAGPMLWNKSAVHLIADTAICNVAYVVTGR